MVKRLCEECSYHYSIFPNCKDKIGWCFHPKICEEVGFSEKICDYYNSITILRRF